jgi:hypothetical protein
MSEVLSKFNLKVIEKMTTPSRAGKKPRPVYIVAGSVLKFEELFRSIGGKKFRGEWSFWENPTNEIENELEQNGENYTLDRAYDYKLERKEAKAERLGGYAENAEQRSNQLSTNAVDMLRCLPMGQPILVGHHSEKGHRRLLERSDNKMRRAVEESEKAKNLAWRAKSLAYDVKKMQSLTYLQNQIKKNQHLVNKYKAYQDGRFYINGGRYETEKKEVSPETFERYQLKINEYQELVDFYTYKLNERKKELSEEGHFVLDASKINKGDLVQYHGQWYPVVKINKLTITILYKWNESHSANHAVKFGRITGHKAQNNEN